MIRIEFKEDTITEGLADLSRLLSDLTPVMQEIGEFLISTTEARFAASESPEGTKWAPKSQTTRDAYARRGQRVDIRPLFGPSGMLSSTIAAVPTADSVEVGSNMIYAAVMQFGAGKGAFGADKAGRPIPWGNIPARPFIGISDTDRTGILDIVSEWLERAVAGQA